MIEDWSVSRRNKGQLHQLTEDCWPADTCQLAHQGQ